MLTIYESTMCLKSLTQRLENTDRKILKLTVFITPRISCCCIPTLISITPRHEGRSC